MSKNSDVYYDSLAALNRAKHGMLGRVWDLFVCAFIFTVFGAAIYGIFVS